ncbi:LOW QUALITY PROTEIN: hypothetical protein CVT25_003222 [Psilocybe cyanescens]|uniref:BTB domain-containing protein n=1 Tax=Psilocybe cyanescens TaxID=93625 RepID=A0A409WM95_PSICY|nr:LOW QUALITY PROTEIN: hypothetical protein CVT25_003222 [Psilocybe cyanescens]
MSTDLFRLTDRWSVNTSNADLKVRSSDGVEFDLHRTVLAVHTGAFPGPEIGTSGEVIELTERANVLRICFDFMYPKRHPDLDDIDDFDLLAAVAEAVGKYQIFSAINTCNTRLRLAYNLLALMPSHRRLAYVPFFPNQILVFAIKHDHRKLMEEAVPYIALSTSFTSAIRLISSSSALVAMSQYRDAWTAVFKSAIKHIRSLRSSSDSCHCHSLATANSKQYKGSPQDAICYACNCLLLTWVSHLEDIESVPILNATVQDACDKGTTTIPRMGCCSVNATGKPDSKCFHLVEVARLCQKIIRKIPPFSTFVNNKR